MLILAGMSTAIPFVLFHGAGAGMLTIVRRTLPLALFGPAGHGLRTGLVAAPARIQQGGAPLLFGLVPDRAAPAATLTVSISQLGSLLGKHGPCRNRHAAPGVHQEG